MSSRKNNNILVIGGRGLVGRIIVEYFTTEKYNVCVIDNVNDYKTDDRVLEYFKADINNSKQLHEVAKALESNFDNLHCVINCSYPRSKLYGLNVENISLEVFNENVKLHLGGYFNVMKVFIEKFIQQGFGNIINFSSVQGAQSPKFHHYKDTNMTSPVEYTAAKSAIIAISKYFAKYYKDKNIRINCISPGGIFDNQTNKFIEKYNEDTLNKGLLDPEDILGTVKFLISDDSKYINGQNIIVDDGWSL